MNDEPVLRADRWTVRPISEADRDGIAEAGRDPQIRLMPWFGTNFQDEWAGPWIARAQAARADAQHWVFSILDRDGSYAGSIAFTSGGAEGLEVAYWTLPRYRGQGAASSALQVTVPWVQAALRPARIWAKVHDRNAASLRVLEKSGFARTHRKGEFIYFAFPVSFSER